MPDDQKQDLSLALELEKLKAELEEAQKKAQNFEDIAKRAQADLQNFRRRSEQEKADFVRFAKMEFILQLLPIVDNFARAAEHTPEDLKTHDWVKGISAIEKQFEGMIAALGLEKIKTVGEKFNPHFHEAVAEGQGEKDTVIEELEKGYILNDKVVRPAKVKVGNGKIS